MPIPRFDLLLIGVSLLTLSAPAYAVSILNIDKQAHRVEILPSAGRQAHTVEIPPGRRADIGNIASQIRLVTGEQSGVQNARDLDEYVIWPGGKMYIQHRRHITGTAWH